MPLTFRASLACVQMIALIENKCIHKTVWERHRKLPISSTTHIQYFNVRLNGTEKKTNTHWTKRKKNKQIKWYAINLMPIITTKFIKINLSDVNVHWNRWWSASKFFYRWQFSIISEQCEEYHGNCTHSFNDFKLLPFINSFTSLSKQNR